MKACALVTNRWYDQSDLEEVKAKFKIDQADREEQRKTLQSHREALQELLEVAYEAREEILQDENEYTSGLISNLQDGKIKKEQQEVERFYWTLLDRGFRIEFLLRDLVIQERRDLEYIARFEDRLRARKRAERYETIEGEEAQVRDNGKGLTPRAKRNRERSANFAKNRQHKNRASKRHDDVSSESPNQNS